MFTMKEQIKNNDILVFRNGRTIIYNEISHKVILDNFYNELLESVKDANFDIVSVKRPYYEDIFKTPHDIHNMSRTQLENELIEKRLQVDNLIKEIERKDEYLKVYSNYLNEDMKKRRVLK